MVFQEIENITIALLFSGDFIPSEFVPRAGHAYYMIAGKEVDFPHEDMVELSIALWRSLHDAGFCNHRQSCRYLKTRFPSNPIQTDLKIFRSLDSDLNLLGINILLRLSSQKAFSWSQFYYSQSGVKSKIF